MKKKTVFLVLFFSLSLVVLCGAFVAYSQNHNNNDDSFVLRRNPKTSKKTHVISRQDSVVFVSANWLTDTMDGFFLHRHQFRFQPLFGSAQNVYYVEIPADSPRRIDFAYDSILTAVSQQAARKQALAAVNGSYFDMDKGNPVCFLRLRGKDVGENVPGKTDSINRKYYQYATIVLRNGRPLLRVPDSGRVWEQSLREENVMTAGPMLRYHGKTLPQRTDRTFVTQRHNRTALGIRADKSVLLVAVDGRFKEESEGMTLFELEHVMRWLGCVDAVNLDGGGSTTLYVKGWDDNGIVNYPSDDGRYTHQGERPVSNVILVR